MGNSEKQCSNIAEFKETADQKDGKAFGYLEAKITEVASRDVNKKDGTTSVVTDLTLEDDTGSIVLALWDSETAWKAGDVFSGTALYTSTFKGTVQLNASRNSKISKKMASGKPAAAAKSTTQKSGAAAKPTTSSGGGGSTLSTIALEKKIDNMKAEILNAITETKVVVLDQLKEVVKLYTGPSEATEGGDETAGEDASQEDTGEGGEGAFDENK